MTIRNDSQLYLIHAIDNPNTEELYYNLLGDIDGFKRNVRKVVVLWHRGRSACVTVST